MDGLPAAWSRLRGPKVAGDHGTPGSAPASLDSLASPVAHRPQGLAPVASRPATIATVAQEKRAEALQWTSGRLSPCLRELERCSPLPSLSGCIQGKHR